MGQNGKHGKPQVRRRGVQRPRVQVGGVVPEAQGRQRPDPACQRPQLVGGTARGGSPAGHAPPTTRRGRGTQPHTHASSGRKVNRREDHRRRSRPLFRHRHLLWGLRDQLRPGQFSDRDIQRQRGLQPGHPRFRLGPRHLHQPLERLLDRHVRRLVVILPRRGQRQREPRHNMGRRHQLPHRRGHVRHHHHRDSFRERHSEGSDQRLLDILRQLG